MASIKNKKGYSQKRNRRADQIDWNDAIFAVQRSRSRIVRSIPAPISIYESGEHKGREKINPHVSRFELANGEIMDVFHVKPVYYLHQNGGWRPMSEITSWLGNHKVVLKDDWAQMMDMRFMAWLIKRMELIGGRVYIPSPFPTPVSRFTEASVAQIHFATSTFYPDPNTETTSVDGFANDDNNQATGRSWASVHDNTTGGSRTSVDDSGTQLDCRAVRNNDNACVASMSRSMTLFDTSALTSGATITAAVLSLWHLNKGDANSDSVGIVSASGITSNTSIVWADFCGAFTLHGDTSGCDVALSSITTGQYTDYTLNSTGRGWISKTSITKMGQRMRLDYNSDASHTTQPSCNTQNGTAMSSADQTGTSQDPKLAVTYTVASGAKMFAMIAKA